MDHEDMKARADAVRARARGNWAGILAALLTNEAVINRKNQPCPRCGTGKDRFQYTDKFGQGDAHCRKCGHMDGFDLLQCERGWSFRKVLLEVEKLVGDEMLLRGRSQRQDRRELLLRLAQRIWNEAQPIRRGDPVHLYLRTRGVGMDACPATLRCHPALGYYVREAGSRKATLLRRLPAMLARLEDERGTMVALLRTYVENGRRADLQEARKCLAEFAGGPVVRLFPATDELAFAEGIEKSLAVHLRTGLPVWSTCSAANMEKAWFPTGLRRYLIYGDHDESFTGQAAAHVLARRIKAHAECAHAEVRVFIPGRVGTDWEDVWRATRPGIGRAA